MYLCHAPYAPHAGACRAGGARAAHLLQVPWGGGLQCFSLHLIYLHVIAKRENLKLEKPRYCFGTCVGLSQTGCCCLLPACVSNVVQWGRRDKYGNWSIDSCLLYGLTRLPLHCSAGNPCCEGISPGSPQRGKRWGWQRLYSKADAGSGHVSKRRASLSQSC